MFTGLVSGRDEGLSPAFNRDCRGSYPRLHRFRHVALPCSRLNPGDNPFSRDFYAYPRLLYSGIPRGYDDCPCRGSDAVIKSLSNTARRFGVLQRERYRGISSAREIETPFRARRFEVAPCLG